MNLCHLAQSMNSFLEDISVKDIYRGIGSSRSCRNSDTWKCMYLMSNIQRLGKKELIPGREENGGIFLLYVKRAITTIIRGREGNGDPFGSNQCLFNYEAPADVVL